MPTATQGGGEEADTVLPIWEMQEGGPEASCWFEYHLHCSFLKKKQPFLFSVEV